MCGGDVDDMFEEAQRQEERQQRHRERRGPTPARHCSLRFVYLPDAGQARRKLGNGSIKAALTCETEARQACSTNHESRCFLPCCACMDIFRV